MSWYFISSLFQLLQEHRAHCQGSECTHKPEWLWPALGATTQDPSPGPRDPQSLLQQCWSPAAHSLTHVSHWAVSLSPGCHPLPRAGVFPMGRPCSAPSGSPWSPECHQLLWHAFLVKQHHTVGFFFPKSSSKIDTETSCKQSSLPFPLPAGSPLSTDCGPQLEVSGCCSDKQGWSPQDPRPQGLCSALSPTQQHPNIFLSLHDWWNHLCVWWGAPKTYHPQRGQSHAFSLKPWKPFHGCTKSIIHLDLELQTPQSPHCPKHDWSCWLQALPPPGWQPPKSSWCGSRTQLHQPHWWSLSLLHHPALPRCHAKSWGKRYTW